MNALIELNPEVGGNGLMDHGKVNVISRQLYLILHSRKCRQTVCPNSYCELMKNILSHMDVCNAEKRCPIRHCRSSRQMLFHWDTHRCGHTCPVCRRVRLKLNVCKDLSTDSEDGPNIKSIVTTSESSKIESIPLKGFSSAEEMSEECLGMSGNVVNNVTEGFDSMVLESVLEFVSK